MRLRELTLAGFRSYREPETIDFTGLGFAVISGRNGDGKSTILDALKWALWNYTSTPVQKDII